MLFVFAVSYLPNLTLRHSSASILKQKNLSCLLILDRATISRCQPARKRQGCLVYCNLPHIVGYSTSYFLFVFSSTCFIYYRPSIFACISAACVVASSLDASDAPLVRFNVWEFTSALPWPCPYLLVIGILYASFPSTVVFVIP